MHLGTSPIYTIVFQCYHSELSIVDVLLSVKIRNFNKICVCFNKRHLVKLEDHKRPSLLLRLIPPSWRLNLLWWRLRRLKTHRQFAKENANHFRVTIYISCTKKTYDLASTPRSSSALWSLRYCLGGRLFCSLLCSFDTLRRCRLRWWLVLVRDFPLEQTTSNLRPTRLSGLSACCSRAPNQHPLWT